MSEPTPTFGVQSCSKRGMQTGKTFNGIKACTIYFVWTTLFDHRSICTRLRFRDLPHPIGKPGKIISLLPWHYVAEKKLLSEAEYLHYRRKSSALHSRRKRTSSPRLMLQSERCHEYELSLGNVDWFLPELLRIPATIRELLIPCDAQPNRTYSHFKPTDR